MTWTPPNCPLLAVDVVVIYPHGIVAIKRKFPPLGFALPGGFVEKGETVEDAARREIYEELGIELGNLQFVGVFSDPERDPRQHVVSVAFMAEPKDAKKLPVAGDDAVSFEILPLSKTHETDWCFDHYDIIARSFGW